MKKLIILTMFILVVTVVYADNAVTTTASAYVTGTAFPKITVKALDDKEIVLPEAVKDKAAMLMLTFSRPDDNDMASWVKPFALKYMGNTQTAYYEMALVGDVGILNGIIYNGMKGGATEEQKAHLVVFFGDKEPYKKFFSVKDDSLIYVCVLDKQGDIKLFKQGKRATEEDIKEIAEAIDLILAPAGENTKTKGFKAKNKNNKGN